MAEREYCRWCAGEMHDPRGCTCPHDCGISGCPQRAETPADELDDWDDEPCSHECDEGCEDYQGFDICSHAHCMNCGGCNCPGYCDDYQTYNLRPAETGGTGG